MPTEVESEVLSIRAQLEKITSPDADQTQALDLLKTLGQLKVNLTVLTNTRIGMTVNSLRKSSQDEEVITLAKSLIKTWKKFVPADSGGEKKAEGKKADGDKKEDAIAEHLNKSFPPKQALATSDDVRLRCRKMLAAALKGDGLPDDGVIKSPEELADIIEDTILKKFKETNPKYKNQVRSRVFNLKDKKNPALRENVLCGVIAAEQLALMSSEEMASDDVKEQRAQFVKEGIDSSRLAIAEGTKTDLLQCGKCKKRNCTYNQLQTRSADEPMTTFALCNECGNRWKFC